MCREQVDRFPEDVLPGRRVADGEAAGQTGDGVTVAKLGQGEQGLSAGVEAPSPTFVPGAFGAPVGQVVQGAAGRRAAPADLIHRPDGRPMIRAASGMLLSPGRRRQQHPGTCSDLGE
ncbi:hypothetical protein F4558_001758 [Micromonospora profundi]|nr:hypothetical protein [Micromonospora profundi]